MGDGEVVDTVADAEVITIWAVAEDWERGRGKKGLGAKSRSKAKSEAKSEARSEAKSEAKSEARSKAADRSVRSTQAKATGAAADEASASPWVRLDPKQLGEIAEAEFIAKVVGLRFVAAKPWGDSESFDFIVNMRRTFYFWRVQVKSAHVVGRDGTYSFGAHNGARESYTAEDIDALVAYVRPERAWYVLPVRVVEGLKGLKLSPGSRGQRSKYEKYREAWHILRKPVRRRRKK